MHPRSRSRCVSRRRRRRSLAPARRSRPPIASASPARSKRPTCSVARPGRRTRCSSSASPKAIASKAGDLVARLDTADAELALARARAEREQAEAQLRLLLAGARVGGHPPGRGAGRAPPMPTCAPPTPSSPAAQADVDRFEALLASNSGSRKQRDDAVRGGTWRRRARRAPRDRVARRAKTSARLRAGARREEIDAARARVAAADAQIATLEKAIADATVAVAHRRHRHREARGGWRAARSRARRSWS